MFERRLKIFLGIVITLALVLLVRAGELQLVEHAEWQVKAADTMRRSTLVDPLRGRILDVRGKEMAVDSPSIDAAVDYRAIVKDTEWIKEEARERLRNRPDLAGERQNRKAQLDEEIAQVSADIDDMWQTLSRVSGKSPDDIEEIKFNITRQVQLRRYFVGYKRYDSARQKYQQEADQQSKEPPSWLKRVLLGDASDAPQADDFKVPVEEETQAHVILRDIDNDQYVELSKRLERCPGLVLRKSTHRRYSEPANFAAAHLLGRLAPVTKVIVESDPYFGKDELRQLGFNDQVGVLGLEKLFDLKLRGSRGRIEKYLGHTEPIETVKPEQGQDVRCTIDLDLQVQIMSAFQRIEVGSEEKPEVREGLHGAAVVIDVPTGEVRAMVSYPTFDLNTLDSKYSELAANLIEKPLMDRATMDQLEPGSTAKTMVGSTAISKGFIGLHEGIECRGYLILPDPRTGREVKHSEGRCWIAKQYEHDPRVPGIMHHPVPFPHHGSFGNPDGSLTVPEALERSCNVVFETIADRMGLAELTTAFSNFGLGRRTGIGIEEMPGRIPSATTPDWNRKSTTWFAGIGQGQVWATPLQMANVAATLARNGVWIRPHLLADETIRAVDRRDLGLSAEALAAVREGMIRVVNCDSGTGPQAWMSEFTVAAKTGSAQTGKFKIPMRDAQGKDVYANGVRQYTVYEPGAFPWYHGVGDNNDALAHAWYLGYAPAENPRIAFCVLVEYGGSGGKVAGPIAKRLLEACMEHGYLAPTPGGAAKFPRGD